jgi:diketogulonate reductase-like aldo/keto reductase
MAYSPLGQGTLLQAPKLRAIARRLETTPAALALAWLLRTPNVIAIPESADPAHMRANHAAATLRIDAPTLRELDTAFPPPDGPTPLAVI